MILENDSFPLPLSPVINTDMSVGATCIATRTALFSRGDAPMIPKRCLTLCISESVMLMKLLCLLMFPLWNFQPTRLHTDPFEKSPWGKQSLYLLCSAPAGNQ